MRRGRVVFDDVGAIAFCPHFLTHLTPALSNVDRINDVHNAVHPKRNIQNPSPTLPLEHIKPAYQMYRAETGYDDETFINLILYLRCKKVK